MCLKHTKGFISIKRKHVLDILLNNTQQGSVEVLLQLFRDAAILLDHLIKVQIFKNYYFPVNVNALRQETYSLDIGNNTAGVVVPLLNHQEPSPLILLYT